MSKVIMVGCDLHDRSMLLRYGANDGEPQQASFANDREGRAKMIERLKQFGARQRARRIVFVYEASGQGYGLCDLLYDHGIECHVPENIQKEEAEDRCQGRPDALGASPRICAGGQRIAGCLDASAAVA